MILMHDCNRYALKREVATCEVGFSVEYVRFQTGRQDLLKWAEKDFCIVIVQRLCVSFAHFDSEPCPYRVIRFGDFYWSCMKRPNACEVILKKRPPQKIFKEATNVAVKEKIRIRIKGYDHQLVDQAAEKIVATAKRTGARVSGPIPLPTEKEVVTILRAVHKYKDSREQFETRTHKRLIDILRPSNRTVDAITALELPAGVEVEVKL